MEESDSMISVKDVEKRKYHKDDHALMITDKNYAYKAFPYNHHGVHKWIPEPDPVLIYFHSAYINFKSVEQLKQKIFDVLSGETVTEKIINDLYSYFGVTNGYVIFLFTAIEAFINKHIPDDFIYSETKTNRTEVYNKEQILRYLSFDVKMKNILVKATKKDFFAKFPNKAIHIKNLKEFRDIIVHTKMKSDGHTPYDYLYKTALKFKYEETIDAVADFFNFYQDNYIEPCPCSQEY